jgi:hypothetical protein
MLNSMSLNTNISLLDRCFNVILCFWIFQGVSIPIKDTEDLLDLLCFFNSVNPPETLLAEELFFLRDVNPELTKKKRLDWK